MCMGDMQSHPARECRYRLQFSTQCKGGMQCNQALLPGAWSRSAASKLQGSQTRCGEPAWTTSSTSSALLPSPWQRSHAQSQEGRPGHAGHPAAPGGRQGPQLLRLLLLLSAASGLSHGLGPLLLLLLGWGLCWRGQCPAWTTSWEQRRGGAASTESAAFSVTREAL